MAFAPHLKRKRGVSNKWTAPAPFPNIVTQGRGLFTGISVEICDESTMAIIYESGFGKGSKSRGAPQIIGGRFQKGASDVVESLALGLEEAFILAYYLNVMKIYDMQDKEISWEQLLMNGSKLNPDFLECLAAYLYLKAKGWIVKSGIKFGGNFLIYKNGPRFYHASFVVLVSTPSNNGNFVAKNIKGIQRIAETSDKDVLLLEVYAPPDFRLESLSDMKSLEISETIARRFNSTAFVQNQKPTK